MGRAVSGTPCFAFLLPQLQKGIVKIQASIAPFLIRVRKGPASRSAADQVGADSGFAHGRIVAFYNSPGKQIGYGSCCNGGGDGSTGFTNHRNLGKEGSIRRFLCS